MSEYGELERGNLLCIIDWILENAAIDGELTRMVLEGISVRANKKPERARWFLSGFMSIDRLFN